MSAPDFAAIKRRAEMSMADYDALPPDLRAWVGIGVPAVAMFAAAAWLQRGAA